MSHNLDATVFVYQSRIDGRIQAEYLDTAKVMEDSPDWEHLDTIEPRMWIQVHYDYAAKMIAAGNRMAAMLDTSLTAPIEEWPDEPEIDAALKEWRFAVDPCPLADDGKGIDDTALLRQALEALEFAWRAMPGKWEIGNAAITALRERLK
jgi:hypothetical protein